MYVRWIEIKRCISKRDKNGKKPSEPRDFRVSNYQLDWM